jgi:hypothetical protein
LSSLRISLAESLSETPLSIGRNRRRHRLRFDGRRSRFQQTFSKRTERHGLLFGAWNETGILKSRLTIALFAGSGHYRHTKKPAKSLILTLPRPITPQNNESKALFYWASCISKNTFHASFHE